MTTRTRIPTHLIAGPLGVGKTTAILDYLKRHAEGEFTAVLVNDFGPTGLDKAIMEGDLARMQEATKILMIPGGCICCTAATGVMGALDNLCKLPRVDRIIIEPSGLTLLGQMVDLLRSLVKDYPLEMRPTIVLIDPPRIARPGFTKIPYFVRMIEAADILVANRSDLATGEQVAAFEAWAGGLYPPKLRILTTQQGRLPAELFDLALPHSPAEDAIAIVSQITQADPLFPPHPAEDHTSGTHAGGLIFEASRQFSATQVEAVLRRLATTGVDGVQVARLKAILHTTEGWRLLEIACGEVFTRDTDYRRDSRLDWIATPRAIAPETMRGLLG